MQGSGSEMTVRASELNDCVGEELEQPEELDRLILLRGLTPVAPAQPSQQSSETGEEKVS